MADLLTVVKVTYNLYVARFGRECWLIVVPQMSSIASKAARLNFGLVAVAPSSDASKQDGSFRALNLSTERSQAHKFTSILLVHLQRR